MRIGCCLPGGSFMPQGEKEVPASTFEVLLAGDKAVMEAGYDFSESTLGMILSLTEEEADRLAKAKAEGNFHLEACNCFIPGSLPICAGEKRAELRDYVEKAMARMQKLGVETVVFGSGGARRIPDGMDRATAMEEIANFLTMCNDVAQNYGVTVVIEPLNHKECNVLLTVAEGAELARRVDLPYIKLLADSYHVFVEDEDLSHIWENKDILRHIHVAEVPDRVYPGRDGGEYLKKFAQALRQAGYEGRVTVECGFTDFLPEMQAAGKFLLDVYK